MYTPRFLAWAAVDIELLRISTDGLYIYILEAYKLATLYNDLLVFLKKNVHDRTQTSTIVVRIVQMHLK